MPNLSQSRAAEGKQDRSDAAGRQARPQKEAEYDVRDVVENRDRQNPELKSGLGIHAEQAPERIRGEDRQKQIGVCRRISLRKENRRTPEAVVRRFAGQPAPFVFQDEVVEHRIAAALGDGKCGEDGTVMNHQQARDQ